MIDPNISKRDKNKKEKKRVSIKMKCGIKESKKIQTKCKMVNPMPGDAKKKQDLKKDREKCNEI